MPSCDTLPYSLLTAIPKSIDFCDSVFLYATPWHCNHSTSSKVVKNETRIERVSISSIVSVKSFQTLPEEAWKGEMA